MLRRTTPTSMVPSVRAPDTASQQGRLRWAAARSRGPLQRDRPRSGWSTPSPGYGSGISTTSPGWIAPNTRSRSGNSPTTHGHVVARQYHHGETTARQVLLVWEALIGGHQHIEPLLGSREQLAVLDTGPAELLHGRDREPRESGLHDPRRALVEQFLNASQAAGASASSARGPRR